MTTIKKNKERLRKEARKRYQNLSQEENEKNVKKAWEIYQNLTKEEKEKNCKKNLSDEQRKKLLSRTKHLTQSKEIQQNFYKNTKIWYSILRVFRFPLSKFTFWKKDWAPKFDIFLTFSKSYVVQQHVRPLLYQVCYTRYQVSFYLWRFGPVLNF